MSPLLLYLHLLKATATTFAGLASLPVLQADLVAHHHVVTNQQLNVSIVVTRSTPGPAGLYVVSAGYFVAGVWGAVAGWAAMVTPALSAVGLLRFLGRRADHPRAASAIQAVVLASAGLLWVDALPLGRQAITDPLVLAILILGAGVLATRRVESVWVILGSAIVYLAAASLRLVSGL
ncbi:MAG TPA: chromate transporter [Solirubrobacteraceae bacterium]|nr:chromate transporter [Solirubrobacteraceae bacterium]